jgi:hypothetical protein
LIVSGKIEMARAEMVAASDRMWREAENVLDDLQRVALSGPKSADDLELVRLAMVSFVGLILVRQRLRAEDESKQSNGGRS